MRFCPFCSAENPSEATHCATCARKLPPLPPRRQAAVASAPTPAPAAAPVAAPPAVVSGTLLPPPSALRRIAQAPEPRLDGAAARRRTDSVPPPLPAAAPPPIVVAPPPIVVAPAPVEVAPPPVEVAPPPAAEPAPPKLPPAPHEMVPGAPPVPLPTLVRDATSVDPPPTRIARPTELADRPFTPPKVIPVPEVPEPGLANAVRYAIAFERARWQRRGAIKRLGEEIRQDTASLDLVLGSLGHQARELHVDSRAIAGENAAITAAEERKTKLDQASADLTSRKNDETTKFAEVERDRQAKVSDAERIHEDAARELSSYEGQRRSLRDKRKEVERRQRAYLKAAEDRENSAGASPMGDARAELRRAAEEARREAAQLEPERQDLDRRLAALDRPLGQAQARVDAARAELESARRSLNDAREGYRHRVAEIDAEQGRKGREVAQAESEIQRRLVTLGTLINLNRIDHPGFAELYERIDRLRQAIGARTTEIDKLTAEREAYDRGSRVRGFVTLAGGVVVLITLIVIILALV